MLFPLKFSHQNICCNFNLYIETLKDFTQTIHEDKKDEKRKNQLNISTTRLLFREEYDTHFFIKNNPMIQRVPLTVMYLHPKKTDYGVKIKLIYFPNILGLFWLFFICVLLFKIFESLIQGQFNWLFLFFFIIFYLMTQLSLNSSFKNFITLNEEIETRINSI